ncbi:hypothetical protein [Bremerella volcania]|nr:hypothetical protein [Bremerella volcania]
MKRKGDEGFQWCGAFVNWSLAQTGIEGTRDALLDEVDGQFKMLGGNQKPEHGKGPRCVSYPRINLSSVAAYRMPRAN